MPLRFFRKENSSAARREREEQIEKALAHGFRYLADILKRSADLIEARRLERGGYEKQEKFLERTSPPQPPPGDKH
ncbi:MAG: hypothetical protein ACOZQL_11400 [Myxococcota bacterium]